MANLEHAVQSLLDELVDTGEETGLQAAIYLEGERVVDCVAGTVAENSTTPVQNDTLFTIYSASKGVIATAFHILAERGLIDYEQRVSHYWPDFGVEGKESVTVAQALNHLAGIPQMVQIEDMSTEDICSNLDLAVAEVARLKPLFAPGSTAIYHGLTIGWIAEGIVRQVIGRGLGDLVKEEIVQPLGLDRELYLGTPVSEHGRMATPYDAPSEPIELDPLVLKCVPLDEPIADILNRPQVRAAQLPAGNISASARALAKHYAATVGQVDGCRLISTEHLERVLSHRVDLPDVFMNKICASPQETPRALAYMLSMGNKIDQSFYGPNPQAFGHDGYGGAFGFGDPDANLGLGYTRHLS